MTRRFSAVALAAMLALVFLATVVGGTSAQVQSDANVTVQSVSVSEERLVAGESGTITATVTNAGDSAASVAVVLVTGGPNNRTAGYTLDRSTLAAGATKTITQPLNATTPGTHTLRIVVLNPETMTQYDVSRAVTITVLAEPPTRLGGPIDRTEVALVALVLSLGGIGIVGYRYVSDSR